MSAALGSEKINIFAAQRSGAECFHDHSSGTSAYGPVLVPRKLGKMGKRQGDLQAESKGSRKSYR